LSEEHSGSIIAPMADQNPLNAPTPEQPDVTPAGREPWKTPTLESLDVSQTMSRVGAGGDGGAVGSTLS
jgi:hypothetical protein